MQELDIITQDLDFGEFIKGINALIARVDELEGDSKEQAEEIDLLNMQVNELQEQVSVLTGVELANRAEQIAASREMNTSFTTEAMGFPDDEIRQADYIADRIEREEEPHALTSPLFVQQ